MSHKAGSIQVKLKDTSAQTPIVGVSSALFHFVMTINIKHNIVLQIMVPAHTHFEVSLFNTTIILSWLIASEQNSNRLCNQKKRNEKKLKSYPDACLLPEGHLNVIHAMIQHHDT